MQALAWPLERGRDSWDYWLWFLELFDRDPPFSALMSFRTPITPVVVGLPMQIGGAALLEVVMALIYALTIVGWAWAVRPLGHRLAVATGLVMLINVPFAGLFHEVSSDFVFAALFALFAGLVIRASPSEPTARRLASVGVSVALLTLCRPTGQVALLACLLIPLLARKGVRPRVTGVAVAVLAAAIPLGLWATHNALRFDDFTVARGGKAWVPFFKVAGRVDPANGDASQRLAEAVEQEVLTQPPYADRSVDIATYFRRRRQSRGDQDDRALRPGLWLGLGLLGALRRFGRGDPRRSGLVRPRCRRDRSGTFSRSDTPPSRGCDPS